ncbi:hypothetical protein ABT173_34320 [Streptomyces sp. NPDC001795]|uniref:hypothetical protein n=1 Tax=unclassified Streptomyces TaxID=2593676 RepID=UPI00332C86B5
MRDVLLVEDDEMIRVQPRARSPSAVPARLARTSRGAGAGAARSSARPALYRRRPALGVGPRGAAG